ncbi:MAG: hypothetical protein GC160_09920 [Acidobacteria bacterium]|nr:hypothetical protein [Acidobacteriota bacterium]
MTRAGLLSCLLLLGAALLGPSFAAAGQKSSDKAQVAAAKERNKRAAKQLRRRSSGVQKLQARREQEQMWKEARRLQSERRALRHAGASDERLKEIKGSAKTPEPHRAVHSLDAPPAPKPDSTPKPKVRGVSSADTAQDK